VKDTKLFAPMAYWNTSRVARAEICNGCGPGKLGDFLVPDTLWGLCVTPACNIHDWMYAMGETIEDKKVADRTFLNNLLRIVDANTRFWPLRKLRRLRAYTYYRAVKYGGGPAYWAGKNPDTTFKDMRYA